MRPAGHLYLVPVRSKVKDQVHHTKKRQSSHSDQEISCDENSRGSGSELPHDDITVLLLHIAMLRGGREGEREGERDDGGTQLHLWSPPHHGGDGEVPRVHLLCEPVYLPTSVDKDHSLGNGQRLVQVTECVKLPFLEEREGGGVREKGRRWGKEGGGGGREGGRERGRKGEEGGRERRW